MTIFESGEIPQITPDMREDEKLEIMGFSSAEFISYFTPDAAKNAILIKLPEGTFVECTIKNETVVIVKTQDGQIFASKAPFAQHKLEAEGYISGSQEIKKEIEETLRAASDDGSELKIAA